MSYLANTKFYIDASAVKPNLPKFAVANRNMISLNDIINNIIDGTLAADNSKVFLQTTTPTAGESTTGDVYINTTTGRIYQYDGVTWNSKINPAVITENKSITYGTYNKIESFTSGNYKLDTTTGDITLSKIVGDNKFVVSAANNGFFDAASLNRIDNTDPLDAKSVTVADSGIYITSAADLSAALAQVYLTDTTVTMQWSDLITPANNARIYCENAHAVVGANTVDIAGTDINLTGAVTVTSDLELQSDNITLSGTLPTTAQKHNKIVSTSAGVVLRLPLLETTLTFSNAGNIAVSNNDVVIEATNATGGVYVLTLPAASSTSIGVKYHIINMASSAHNVEIDTNGTDYMNGNNSTNLAIPAGRCVTLIPYSATSWAAILF